MQRLIASDSPLIETSPGGNRFEQGQHPGADPDEHVGAFDDEIRFGAADLLERHLPVLDLDRDRLVAARNS
ncbi:hypothetical protein [Saccharopolyspora spinosa]